MRIKKLISFLAAGMMAFSLAACGPSDNAPGDDQGGPTVEPGKKGTIEFWTVFTGADGKSMQAMIDAYNDTDPDYTVNHRAIEANDLYLKLPLAVQSKQDVPDVAIVHVERVPLFKENGFLQDYSDKLGDSAIKKENYNPKSWEMTDIDGGHYGIPLDVHSYVLYVNDDLYEKYGNNALEDGVLTWEEIEASGEAAKADNIIPIGMSWLRVKFLAAYAQLGGTFTEDGTNPEIDVEKATKVFDTWTGLQEAGYTQKDGDSTWELFLGGQMLYCPEGIWMYNNVKDAGLNASMYDYPIFEGGSKGNWTSSHQFVLPVSDSRDEEKTQAVLDFIDFIGNNSLEWAKAGQVPANNAIKDSSEFMEMPQAFLIDENEELKIYDYKYYGYMVESLDKVVGEVLFGRMDAESAIKQAVQETKDRIEMGQ
ncbi:MAG: extracellular solute-binding protein [Clostridiaceae bacterium]